VTGVKPAEFFRGLARAVVIAALALAAGALSPASAQVGPFGSMREPAATGIAGWIMAEQAMFYRALATLIHTARTDGSAAWALMGVSFIYGIFHAAGPGHGKAVISSYLVANEETWRRGIILSFAAALLQAVTAIVLVTVAALILGATAKMMSDTVKFIEIGSYALIVLIGARLTWVKGRGFVRALRAAEAADSEQRTHAHAHHHHAHARACDHRDHDHHAHDHAHAAHDHDDEESVLPWCHAHGPEPEELAGPGGWRRGLSAIIAVGLRPCSGAIIVLVFALAQGLFWAGVASTFVMGLGTAITVATIATLAVGARTLAKRLAATRAGYGAVIVRGLEVGAALMVVLFGVLLLTGMMASERMGMF
jgi:ABC-type nickel/cobalt efflux system permease component RcnA